MPLKGNYPAPPRGLLALTGLIWSQFWVTKGPAARWPLLLSAAVVGCCCRLLLSLPPAALLPTAASAFGCYCCLSAGLATRQTRRPDPRDPAAGRSRVHFAAELVGLGCVLTRAGFFDIAERQCFAAGAHERRVSSSRRSARRASRFLLLRARRRT